MQKHAPWFSGGRRVEEAGLLGIDRFRGPVAFRRDPTSTVREIRYLVVFRRRHRQGPAG